MVPGKCSEAACEHATPVRAAASHAGAQAHACTSSAAAMDQWMMVPLTRAGGRVNDPTRQAVAGSTSTLRSDRRRDTALPESCTCVLCTRVPGWWGPSPTIQALTAWTLQWSSPACPATLLAILTCVLCTRVQGWWGLRPMRWEGLVSSAPFAFWGEDPASELTVGTPEGLACPLAVGAPMWGRIWSRCRALGSALPLKRSCRGAGGLRRWC